MKIKIILKSILAISILISQIGCSEKKNEYNYLSEQTINQLHIEESAQETTDKGKQNPDKKTLAIWIPVMEYGHIMKDKNENEFRENANAMIQNIKKGGYNTIYLHVRAYGDAYYSSDLFPYGSCQTDTSYDALEIITRLAHKEGLAVHAWINPMRCQSDDAFSDMDSKYILKQWYEDDEKKGKYLVYVNNNWWLNPYYEDVRKLISDGVKEITDNYNIDGIHIDDFFYPTTDISFDKEAFENSSFDNLSDFRLEQTNKMVKQIYDTVKNKDKDIVFSISPQGTFNGNYEYQSADVKKWMSEDGYCDVIIPQLYYGFENESCPFKEMVSQWQNALTAESVRLHIGICTYKTGTADKFAGNGKNEWIENSSVSSEEVRFVLENEKIDGISIYSYTSTYHTDSETAKKEADAIECILNSYR